MPQVETWEQVDVMIKHFGSLDGLSEELQDYCFDKFMKSGRSEDKAVYSLLSKDDEDAERMRRDDCVHCHVDDIATTKRNANEDDDRYYVVLENGSVYTLKYCDHRWYCDSGDIVITDSYEKYTDMIQHILRSCRDRFCN